MPSPRSLLVSVAAFALLTALGCGGSQPLDDVWRVPGLPAAGSEGYPFTSNTSVVGAGDRVGDLPETGMLLQRGFWRRDEAQALREARATGRGVVIDFYASWCDDCATLDHRTLRDPEVRAAIGERFVPLRIDVTEETHANREQLERYVVTSLPLILVLDDSGRERARIERVVPPDEILDALALVATESGAAVGIGGLDPPPTTTDDR